MKTDLQILAVEDEEVTCESLAIWLREDGYTVDTAASGRDAIEKAREKNYAIYFMDLKTLSGTDGIEILMQIRRLHPEASVIIVSGTVDTAFPILGLLTDCTGSDMRELKNALECTLAIGRDCELMEALFALLAPPSRHEAKAIPVGATLKEMEKVVIADTLLRSNGNIKAAAAALGIDRSTLYEKIKKYEIPR